jgi:hypothetical protein
VCVWGGGCAGACARVRPSARICPLPVFIFQEAAFQISGYRDFQELSVAFGCVHADRAVPRERLGMPTGPHQTAGCNDLTLPCSNYLRNYLVAITYLVIVYLHSKRGCGLRGLQKLMKKIASWLRPEGLLFVHIFVHRSLPYHFEVQALLSARSINRCSAVGAPFSPTVISFLTF